MYSNHPNVQELEKSVNDAQTAALAHLQSISEWSSPSTLETYAGYEDHILKPKAPSKVSENTILDLCASSTPYTSSSYNKHDIDLKASDSVLWSFPE